MALFVDCRGSFKVLEMRWDESGRKSPANLLPQKQGMSFIQPAAPLPRGRMMSSEGERALSRCGRQWLREQVPLNASIITEERNKRGDE